MNTLNQAEGLVHLSVVNAILADASFSAYDDAIVQAVTNLRIEVSKIPVEHGERQVWDMRLRGEFAIDTIMKEVYRHRSSN